MKDRNHLAEVKTTNKVEIITKGVVDIPMLQILSAEGELIEKAVEPDLSKEEALKIFNTMHYIRVLDERMVGAQRQGRISFYLASTGEEAASVASAAALSDDDMIMSQYREQGALAYRGYTTEQFMNQMFSNKDDPNKGRQMPIHYGDKPLNFMTISSPLGTQIPQASGYAYGQKMSGKDVVTICYFGEGAASEGDFHAGLNMAAVLNCPVIFFCRNNGYAISTPAEEQFAGDGIASRGLGYGIKTIRVDGNDVLAIHAATKEARRIAIEEKCPVLIEAMTYRLAAHSTSDDPTGYRSREEEDKWRAKDPIARMAKWLESKGWFDEAENQKRVDKARQDVLAAMKSCEKTDVCAIEDIVEDVYDTAPWHLKEQLSELKAHIKKYPKMYPKTAGRVK
ncbi:MULTISPECIES: thiamine pyrophosphate-dependent dehydrogenase E1 component subunit alpha [Alteromonas]|uniref:thiamine pyrophosphate-dependent dehydrogenase E1 component subunit alpha n=1 Tax=Alteromonas TaxID=226 RepID=UPI00027E6C7F|nr:MULTISPECIES: thiamine pyrophosphate-dependent dehydrogenase E1 component subunit alpha [Alteromonas]AFS37437.1 alpha keto acid dehydrogenase complex, E1 component subunit alpha [Alteromonas macleodii ATCC 27126]CAI2390098.1 2-oxoisovalerate dehydrogenase E1 component alpha subunit [Alteromonas macleodii]CAI3955940.1 2-oxoisovalerate dehydrogenase E1 component alpha subunit [Alteromonas macleodii]CAI3956934.1 2-oxoisovalerate dehydrogenase E1 component alpha subunit [Alteromonas macleodii]C